MPVRQTNTLSKACFILILTHFIFAGCSSGNSNTSSSEFEQTKRDAVLYLEEGFEQKSIAPVFNNSIISLEHYTPTQQPFVDFPGKGAVLHYHFPAGFNDTTPTQVGVSGADAFSAITGEEFLNESYFEWDEYFPETHDFANGGQKMFRAGFWGALDSSNPADQVGRTQITLALMWNNSYFLVEGNHPETPTQAEISFENELGIPAPVGEWFTLGIWIKLNSAGKNDGHIIAYLNEKKIAQISNANLRGDTKVGLNYFWIGGNYSNLGVLTSQASSRYIDNIKWYSTKP